MLFMNAMNLIKPLLIAFIIGIFFIAGSELSAAPPKPITVSQLTEKLHYFAGHGGNILISAGVDGVFMVDDQYATQSGPIQDALEKLSLPAPKFLINTHWHHDHSGSNEHFENAGALIFAHENVRKRLSEEQFIAFFKSKVPAAHPAALPVVTFSDRMNLHINGDDIIVLHAPNAHTDGDAMIYFERDNVLHTGDVFFENMYPFIDTSSGGTVGGVIEAIEAVLPMLDEETRIVPGHGPITDKKGMVAYQKMLQSIQKNIAGQIIAGHSEEQVVLSKPTKAFDERYASGFLKPDNFVRLIYQNIVYTTLN